MIYLDNAATTMVSTSAFLSALPYMLNDYGNPSSIHKKGIKAKKAIEKSRKQIADAIGTTPEHIIFTSGGSEANSLALCSAAQYLKRIGKTHIITTKAEHDSVKNVIKSSFYKDFKIDYLPLNRKGSINLSELIGKITDETGLVIIMGINNETGAKFPIYQIGRICKERGILYHMDGVQSFTCMSVYDIDNIGIDFMSVSGHKIHALKGSGFLYAKNPELIHPLILGGHQENGYRAGTENTCGIVSLGTAAVHAMAKYPKIINQYKELWDVFTHELSKKLYLNFPQNQLNLYEPGKICSLRTPNVDAETLVLELSNKGVCVSAGSACNSNSDIPSESLLALGLTPKQAKNTIRVSFSEHTTKSQVRRAARIIGKTVYELQNSDYKYTSLSCI